MSAPPPPTDNLKQPGSENVAPPPVAVDDNNPGPYEDLNRKCKGFNIFFVYIFLILKLVF